MPHVWEGMDARAAWNRAEAAVEQANGIIVKSGRWYDQDVRGRYAQ